MASKKIDELQLFMIEEMKKLYEKMEQINMKVEEMNMKVEDIKVKKQIKNELKLYTQEDLKYCEMKPTYQEETEKYNLTIPIRKPEKPTMPIQPSFISTLSEEDMKYVKEYNESCKGKSYGDLKKLKTGFISSRLGESKKLREYKYMLSKNMY